MADKIEKNYKFRKFAYCMMFAIIAISLIHGLPAIITAFKH